MVQYKCMLCGWVYDSEKGDAAHGIDAGTLFEDLPDDWKCPLCGASKDMFEKVE
ncbi:rubredoxin [Candidatus Methanosphaera massiliense]|jgi:rubredoxin|uniref:rubredoxin n=1 Tax=Methanosphaera TaxID=2316 RepID=UPI000DC4D498|nr:rubredoxin [Candidatus Methanosphaera massiliense]MDD6286601.1 rubredoxin [Methanobacteriaceae archaeon]MDE4078734.1 rubredoxin [Candidatus Methanosphaera massiliense]MDY2744292.1 rubredoxin [Methanosphaera sp.]RAP45340.1 MAG: rubredoxin [Methanosphaera sp. SHI1033]